MGADHPDAGDLVELGHVGGEGCDDELDLCAQGVDVGGECVDAVEHAPGQKGVMVVEVPGQRLGEHVEFGSHAGAG
ncbi:MAG: hypothetical protein JO281_16985 [Pseudonocardiales bacterium]|nr:hypothetical protein [Pseudonocardiales bacterium]